MNQSSLPPCLSVTPNLRVRILSPATRDTSTTIQSQYPYIVVSKYKPIIPQKITLPN